MRSAGDGRSAALAALISAATAIARPVPAGETVDAELQRTLQDHGAGLTVTARLGERLCLRWTERRVFGPAGWTSRPGKMALDCLPPWGGGRGGPVVNWNVVHWLHLKVGGSPALGGLRASGRCNHPRYAIADFFWTNPEGKGPGLVHARFMRTTPTGYLFLRLHVPDAGNAPIEIGLVARAYDAFLGGGDCENIVRTGGGRHAPYRCIGGEKTVTPWRGRPNPEAPALVVTRGIDAYHGGVGVLYDPSQIESLGMSSPGGDPGELPFHLNARAGVRTVHLCLWDYRNLGGEGALARMLDGAEGAFDVFRAEGWQTTRREQVVDLDRLRSRVERVAGAEGMPAKLRSAAQSKLAELEAVLTEHRNVSSPDVLCSLYRLQDELAGTEREMKKRWMDDLQAAFAEGALQPKGKDDLDDLEFE